MALSKLIQTIILYIAYKIAILGLRFLFLGWSIVLLCWNTFNQFLKQIQNEKSLQSKRVVIVGGGFAGVNTAKDLEGRFKVTLIDTKDHFDFTPSALRTIVDPNYAKNIQIKHEDYLDPEVEIIKGRVTSVSDTQVTLEDGTDITFDYLVLSPGSVYCLPFKGANVVMSWTPNNLVQYHKKLHTAKSVIIIGGGLVGVELAAEILESYPHIEVNLVHSGAHLMHTSHVPKKGVEHVTSFLRSYPNLKLILGEFVRKQVGDIFYTDKGSEIFADIGFSCTGIKPNTEFIASSQIAKLDPQGFLKVNPYLQLEGHENIFAAGDAISHKEEKLAQNAESTAYAVAKNIVSHAKGDRFKMSEYVGSTKPKIISLGRYDGVFCLKDFSFGGFIPSLMKEVVERKVMVDFNVRSGKLWMN